MSSMDLKPGDWFKEEWDEKAPEPGRTYYLIDKVDSALITLRRFAVFEKKPELNTWGRMEGVESEKITRRLKAPVTDAAEIARVTAAFDGVPESLEPM